MCVRPVSCVVHSNDGCVDDIMAQTVLRGDESDGDFLGATINSGNCHPDSAYDTMRRIEPCIGLPQSKIGLWHTEMPNPFPAAWRDATKRYSQIDLLKDQVVPTTEAWEATALLQNLLCSANGQVAVLTTGPTSELAATLRLYPKLAARINPLVMMAGAVRVPGNVKLLGCDGGAEWNVYADPVAFAEVLNAEPHIPIRLIGLDVTNQLPVDTAFTERLFALSATSRTASVIAELWKLTAGSHHYLWDPTAAMALIDPGLFEWETTRITIDTKVGPSQGRLTECEGADDGCEIQLATKVDREALLDELFRLLA